MTMSASQWSRARLLYSESRKLVQVRWALGAGALATGLFMLGMSVDGASRIAALGGFVLIANAVLWRSHIIHPALSRRPSTLLRVSTGQILADALVLGLLTAWTGGFHSPAILLYVPLALFIAGLQGGPGLTLLLTASMIVSGLTACLLHLPATAAEWMFFAVWMTTIVATVMLARRIARALAAREGVRIEQARQIRRLAEEARDRQDALAHDEKLVALGSMAAGIAHEIANPLASMDSVLQLMQRHPDQPRPEAVATLRSQVQRILEIIRQLTRHAHPSRGVADLASLDEVVRNSLDLLVFNKRRADVHVDYGLPDERGIVRLNSRSMQQVITNLLVNAMDAVERVAAPRIDVRTRRDGDWCIVEVADNGAGIDPQNLSRIFEPFFTTKPVGRGTGLGLSICKRLVEEQNGRIEVVSAPSKGAIFTVWLPAFDAKASTTPGDSAGKVTASTRREIEQEQSEKENAAGQRRSIGATP